MTCTRRLLVAAASPRQRRRPAVGSGVARGAARRYVMADGAPWWRRRPRLWPAGRTARGSPEPEERARPRLRAGRLSSTSTRRTAPQRPTVERDLEYFRFTGIDLVKIQYGRTFQAVLPGSGARATGRRCPRYGLGFSRPQLEVVEGLVKAAGREALRSVVHALLLLHVRRPDGRPAGRRTREAHQQAGEAVRPRFSRPSPTASSASCASAGGWASTASTPRRRAGKRAPFRDPALFREVRHAVRPAADEGRSTVPPGSTYPTSPTTRLHTRTHAVSGTTGTARHPDACTLLTSSCYRARQQCPHARRPGEGNAAADAASRGSTTTCRASSTASCAPRSNASRAAAAKHSPFGYG